MIYISKETAPTVFCSATSCYYNDKKNCCKADKINICAINSTRDSEEADCLTFMPDNT